jgi:nucleoside-diphosphate-sugar epimerase
MELHSHLNTLDQKNVVLFLGFGYTAQYLAMLLEKENWHYIALSSRNKAELDADMLHKITHIVVTAPPDGNQDPVLNLYRDVIIEKGEKLKWLGYLSATSVYGNHDGHCVTEISACHPTSERGKNRLAVEHLWQALATEYHIPVHIFRLAGIYGANRNTINDVRFSQTVNIIKQGHLTNRIYVKDIARAVFASMNNPTPQEIFNLTDDMPASTAAVNDYIAFLLDKPLLHKIAYDDCVHRLSEMRKSFYHDSKIVSNQKIKEMLNFTLQFPNYRDGIKDILDIELMSHTEKIH